MIDQVKNEYEPDYAIAPGEVLGYELDLREMTQRELAKRTGLTPKHIVSIVKAKAAITPETAIRLERAIGMPADYWLNLEAQYQEAIARLEEEERLERDLGWLKKIPVTQMAKLGWLEKPKKPKEQLIGLLRFFGIASVDQWEGMWPNLGIAYRQHTRHEVFPEAISAWLRKGELEAAEIACQSYDPTGFREALAEIRALTFRSCEEFLPAMRELCAQAGVAVVFVPSLPKTGVSGATRWVSPTKAVIQLSLRYKVNDHLWFTFFHEAGHILLHGKKDLFLEGVNGLDEEKEREADRFAQRELIPKGALRTFIEEGVFSDKSIKQFAEEVGIAPGVVVGQLQYRKAISYNRFNALKDRYEWKF